MLARWAPPTRTRLRRAKTLPPPRRSACEQGWSLGRPLRCRLVREERRLCIDHVEITHQTAPVTVQRNRLRLLCVRHSVRSRLRFASQDAETGKLIFHFLISNQ